MFTYFCHFYPSLLKCISNKKKYINDKIHSETNDIQTKATLSTNRQKLQDIMIFALEMYPVSNNITVANSFTQSTQVNCQANQQTPNVSYAAAIESSPGLPWGCKKRNEK